MDKHCESPTAIYDSTAAAVANVHTAGAIAARHVRTASVKMTTMSAITSSTNADRCETGLPTICDLIKWARDIVCRCTAEARGLLNSMVEAARYKPEPPRARKSRRWSQIPGRRARRGRQALPRIVCGYHHGLLRSGTRIARRVSFIGNGRGHKPLHEAVRASDIEDRPISDLFPKSAARDRCDQRRCGRQSTPSISPVMTNSSASALHDLGL